MSAIPLEYIGPTALTLTVLLYPFDSDSVANGAGDSLTEATVRKGVYQTIVSEPLTGWHTAHIYIGSDLFDVKSVYMIDGVAVCRCEDPPFHLMNVSGAGDHTGDINQEIAIHDVHNNPIPNTKVWITTDIAGTQVVNGIQVSDNFGKVSFLLTPGTYYVWKNNPRYTFTNPTEISVPT